MRAPAVIVPVSATGIGEASIVATLKGPGDLLLDQDYALGVMPPNPPVTRRTTLPLMANGGALTIGKDLMSDMMPGTGSIALSVSPLPQLDAAGLVRDLDRYPYGCSEQTVSRALPLLYLSDLGVSARRSTANCRSACRRRSHASPTRQTGSGSFGLWSAYDGGSLWLSAYVTDFLLRAREKGFEVPEDVLVGGLDYIRNMVGNAPDIEEGQGQDMAYALYVLARAGRAPVGDLKYLADTKLYGLRLAAGPRADSPPPSPCWATASARTRPSPPPSRRLGPEVEMHPARRIPQRLRQRAARCRRDPRTRHRCQGEARGHPHRHERGGGGARPLLLCLDAGHGLDGARRPRRRGGRQGDPP